MEGVTLKEAFLDEGSLNVKDLLSGEANRMNLQHRHEVGGKHGHLVYSVNGREHRFPYSLGKKGDGAIRHVITTAFRRHVRQASGQS